MSQSESLHRKQVEQLALIASVSQELAHAEKTELILEKALAELSTRLLYRAAQIYRLSPYGQDIWLYLSTGGAERSITNLPDIFDVEQRNIVSDSLRRQKLIYVTNVHKGAYATQVLSPAETPIRSEITVPLQVGDSVLGVLRVQSDQLKAFPPADRDFLQSLAQLLATTLNHHHRIEQLENDLQEIKILYNLQRQNDPDQIFDVPYVSGEESPDPSQSLSPVARLALAQLDSVTGSDENGNELVTPIQLHGDPIGVLGVSGRSDGADWGDEDRRLLEEVSDQVALALENARLIQQTQARSRELALLFTASRELSKTVESSKIYAILTEQMVEYLQADWGEVLLLDDVQHGFSSEGVLRRENEVRSWHKAVVPRFSLADDKALSQLLTEAEPFVEYLAEDTVSPRYKMLLENDIHTVAVFPLYARDQVMGILQIGHQQTKREYRSNELQLGRTLIAQVDIAVENALQFQKTEAALIETEQQTERLAQLNQMSRDLSLIQDEAKIFDIAAQQVTEIFAGDRGSICLLNKAKDEVTILALRGNEAIKLGAKLPVKGSMAGVAILENRIMNASDLCDEAYQDYTEVPQLAQQGLRSSMNVPLQVNGQVIGSLNVASVKQNAYTSYYEKLLSQMASHLSAAIENRRLLDQTATALNEAETALIETAQQTERLAELNRMSQQLSLSRSEAETFDVAASYVKNVFGGDRGSITLLTGDKTEVSILALQGNEAIQIGAFLPVDKSRIGVAIRENRIINTLDFADEENQGYLDLQQLQKQGLRTSMIAPLLVNGEVIGTLNVGSTVANSYTSYSEELLGQMASLVSKAIENRRLLDQTADALRETELLYNITRDFAMAQQPGDLLQSLSNSLLVGMEKNVDSMAIGLFDKVIAIQQQQMEVVATWTHPDQSHLIQETFLTYDQYSFLSKLNRTQANVIFVDDLDDTTQENIDRRFGQTKTILAIPLQAGDAWLGSLFLNSCTPRYEFKPQLITRSASLTNQVSVVLRNLQLVKETQQMFEEAQHRATLLQTAADVSEAATSFLELEALLNQAVNLIRDRFGFYHVSIFFVDEYEKYAIIKASTGEVGEKMLAMKHRLDVGGRSIVGTATATRKPHIARDVGQDGVHFNNPLLPETKAEMALPLVARGKIIGALDVQSRNRGAFAENEITILQSMANQLANAIAAALASQETQQTLGRMQKLNEHYLREQWDGFVQEQRKSSGYQLRGSDLLTFSPDNGSQDVTKMMTITEPLISPIKGGEKIRTMSELTASDETSAFQLQIAHTNEMQPAQDVANLLAPLQIQDGAVIGELEFEVTPMDRTWEEDQLRIVQAVTTQAAQAIESARLFEQTQSARDEAEALYHVSRTLVGAEDEQKMYHTILEKMLTNLGLKQGGVLFFDQGREFGTLHALFEDGVPVTAGQVFPIAGNASYERLISTKQPLAIEDALTDPLLEIVRELNQARDLASLLLVPIIVDGEVIGSIGADAVGEKHVFTPREINLASAMADQLSIILQNRRLLDEIHQRALQLRTSAEVSQATTSILDQEAMLDHAVELIKNRFNFYHVQIFLVNEDDGYAYLHKSTGPAGKRLLEMNYKVRVGSAGVIGQATSKRASVVNHEIDVAASEPGPYHKLLPASQAEVAIPLQVGERVIGVLDVHSEQTDAFSKDAIATMELLASQIAIAMQNARAFKEQQETAERLKEVDKLKTQFLANMSHELRTPLNSIIGFSRVILKGIDGPLTELQKTDLTSIHSSGQHLLGLINNILDLSKIEAGKMELNFEEVEIEPIIKGVMSTALALVKDKPVELRQDVADTLPIVWADPTRIRQIILNLVSNACKFTEEGSVTLHATNDDKKLTISVVDTGIGIPEDQRHGIFEEFTQVDASTTRKVGGTGLGLPISRHFVELHKGQIWVETAPAGGASFQFTIPLTSDLAEGASQSEPIASNTSISPDIPNKVIVAIDDDPEVIDLYAGYLETRGYTVVGVDKGDNIIAQVKSHHPAAILLDVLISSGKNGWAIIQELKDDADTENVPVVICTMSSEKNQGFSLGAADFLNKPIAEDDLLKALDRLDYHEKEQVKVIVIDDEADDVLLIRRILEAQRNYVILEASNGQEGVYLVKQEVPDLIILDLTMPKMDGFSVVETLKNNDLTRSIPIIIVSAKDLTPQENKFLTGQVEALLRKDMFTEDDLLKDVHYALTHIQPKEVVNL